MDHGLICFECTPRTGWGRTIAARCLPSFFTFRAFILFAHFWLSFLSHFYCRLSTLVKRKRTYFMRGRSMGLNRDSISGGSAEW